ncbi:MAG TPA: VOC family protein [Rhodothermales bacterium]|nr:VOC family protein [Rhodothermales bacterium]
MITDAVPVLRVLDAAAAERFYCDGLGFERIFAYRPDGVVADPCYLGLARDGAVLHVSSFPGDGALGSLANLLTDDVDGIHAGLVARGVPIDTGPVDQEWGTREVYVRDPSGNRIRFIQHRKG